MRSCLQNASAVAHAPSPAGPFCSWQWWPWCSAPSSPKNCRPCWRKTRGSVKPWTWCEFRIGAPLSDGCTPRCPRPKPKSKLWDTRSWPKWSRAPMNPRPRPSLGACTKRKAPCGTPATGNKVGCHPLCATWLRSRPGPRVAIVAGCKAIAWSCKAWSFRLPCRSLRPGAPMRWAQARSWPSPGYSPTPRY